VDKAKYKQYVELIRSRLSDYRFYHSVCVAEAAVQLAERFGADVEQAYVAGILHDVMKEEEPSVQRAYIEKAGERMSDLEIRIGKVYHQMSGAAYVRLELGITDPDILNAIRYHTTSAPVERPIQFFCCTLTRSIKSRSSKSSTSRWA
jgi:predicted HD superfamily hydrolase involved in NAD metabolism